MGIIDDLLGPNTEAGRIRQCDFQRMAAERMAHGFEPIDWETILDGMRQEGQRYPNFGEAARRVRQQQKGQAQRTVEVIEWDSLGIRPCKHVKSRVIKTKQIQGSVED